MTNLIVRTTKTMLLLAIIATLANPIHGTDKALPCLNSQQTEAIATVKKINTELTKNPKKTIDKLNNLQLTKKGQCVFVLNFDGQMLAHTVNAKLIDKNLLGLRDAVGKFLIKDMIEKAKSGQPAWITYYLSTDKAVPCLKKAYIEKATTKIDGKEALIGGEVFSN
jgi:signal transduction histidine kinase